MTPEPGGTPGTPVTVWDEMTEAVGGSQRQDEAVAIVHHYRPRIEAEAARSERAELERERKLTARHHRALFVTRRTCPDCWNSDHERRP